jgi:hypothetical protein
MTGVPTGFELPLLLWRPAKSKVRSNCPLYPDLQYIIIIINGAVRPDQRRCVAPSKGAVLDSASGRGVTCRSDAYVGPYSGVHHSSCTENEDILITSSENSQ